MNKIRPLYTAKYALQRALEILPIAAFADRLGVSSGLIYKMSDPDIEKEISVERALIIDQMCHAAQGVAPFRDVFVSQVKQSAASSGSIKESMLTTQSALGGLAGAVLNALSDASEGGQRLTPRELQSIMISVEELKQEVDRIERAVIEASKKTGQ